MFIKKEITVSLKDLIEEMESDLNTARKCIIEGEKTEFYKGAQTILKRYLKELEKEELK